MRLNLVTIAWPALWVLASASGCAEPEAPAPTSSPSGPPPALVELETARAGSLTDGWAFLGQVEPALASDLAAAVAGHVLAVNAREGDRVTRGQVLLTLDSAKARAELTAAQARAQGQEKDLELARRQLERVRTLSYPTVSEPEKERYEREVQNLEAQLAIQRAEVQRAQVELARHTLRAPFAGVVGRRHVDPGAWVGVGLPVLSLVSLDDLEVHVDVSARLGGRLEVGQQARLLGPTAAAAEIAGIVGALDASTRTMRVRLIPKDTPPWLLAGLAVDVEFPVTLGNEGSGDDGVIVSRDALIQGPIDTRVIKYVEGKAVPVRVEVLATAGQRALIRPVAATGDGPGGAAGGAGAGRDAGASLAEGDSVVIRGNERLRPGQPLQVVDGDGAAPAKAAQDHATPPAAQSPPKKAGTSAGTEG